MKKDLLPEDRAKELIEWWRRIDRADLDSRNLWLVVYRQHDLSGLSLVTHTQLDVIAQINRETMPKSKGGKSAA